MKTLRLIAVLIITCASALAWNCPAGQVRQQAPPNTPTTTPYYDVVEGIAFICVPTPTADPKGSPVSSTSTSNSNSTSTSGATATGGNSSSTATGGSSTSTSGVKNSGNSTSTSGVKNSGNSSNTNTNTAQGGAGGSASQTQSTSSTATGNGDNANNSTEITNIKPASASAIAPVGFPTAPCATTFGAAAQSIPGGISFGGSHIDKGCDDRQTALQFAVTLGNRLAAAKILCSTKSAKRAKLTLGDCLAFTVPAAPVVVAAPVPAPQPIVIVVPVPQATAVITQTPVLPILHEELTVTATKAQVAQASKKPVKHIGKPCIVPQSLTQPMEK